jgi:undecaprenyl-diphosphatase
MVVFIMTIGEGVPPLGFLLPGQNIVILAGFFARMDELFLPFVLGFVFVGGWIGDLFAYQLGAKYGLPFLKKYGKYVLISDNVLDNIHTILKKNLSRGTILSRFYGWTRGVLPFIAGSLKLPFKKLCIYTGISNLLRSIGYTLLGYVLGASYEIASEYLGTFLTRGLIISVAVTFLFRYFKNENVPFRKSFSRMMIGNILAIILFCILAQRIHTDKLSFVAIDTRIQTLFAKSAFIDTLLLRIDQIFDFWFVGLMGLIVIVYLYRKKLMYALTVFVSTMISAMIAFPLLKLIIQRPRPTDGLMILVNYSFPSGHATMSLVCLLIVWYVLHTQIKSPSLKYLFLAGMVIGALIIGTSRIMLHIHRFTDVVGGFLLGFFIITTNILVWKIFFNQHLEKQKIVKKHSKKLLIDILL